MTIATLRPRLPSTAFWMTKPSAQGTLVFLPDLGGNLLYARHVVSALGQRLGCAGMRLDPEMIAAIDSASVPDLGLRFARDLVAADLPRPLHLAGFSFAGFVAFETARHLASLGHAAAGLWLLDSHVRPRLGPRQSLQSPLSELGYAWRYMRQNWRRLTGLSPEPDLLHGYHLVRMDLSRYPQGQRRIIAALYRAMAAYRPLPWTDGRATLVRAADESYPSATPADLGWRQLLGDLKILEVPGDHLSLLRDPACAARVAAWILRERPHDARGSEA